MCNEKTHFELNPSAHVTQHAMAVETACSMIRFGREGASIEDAEANAQEAWEIKEANEGIIISVACVEMLDRVRKGGLRTSDELQSA